MSHRCLIGLSSRKQEGFTGSNACSHFKSAHLWAGFRMLAPFSLTFLEIRAEGFLETEISLSFTLALGGLTFSESS